MGVEEEASAVGDYHDGLPQPPPGDATPEQLRMITGAVGWVIDASAGMARVREGQASEKQPESCRKRLVPIPTSRII